MGSARPMDRLLHVHHENTVRWFGDTLRSLSYCTFDYEARIEFQYHQQTSELSDTVTNVEVQKTDPFAIQILISTQLKLIEEAGSKEQGIIWVDGAGPDFELPEDRFLGGNKTMHFSATSSDLFIFGSSFFFKCVVFPQWLVIYFQVWLQVELYWNFVRILAHQLPRTLTKVTPSQTLHPVVHCCWGKYLNLSWTSPADVCIRAELQRWITSLFSWPIESSWIERSQKSSLCTDSNIRSLLQQPRHIAILLNSNTLQKGIEDSTHLQLSKMLNQLFIFHTQHSMGNSSGSKDVHTELHLERFKFRSETWFRWQGVSSIPSKSISTCFFVQKGLVVSVMATVFWANFS